MNKEAKRTIVLLREEFDKGFQKGKLEQKKELLYEKQYHLNDLKDCDRTEWIWFNVVIKRLEREIKQLSKEIGGIEE